MTPATIDHSYEVQLPKCPHCGAIKIILASYYLNGDEVVCWSDLRKYYPNINRASYVQRCPYCRKYYFMSDEIVYDPTVYCMVKASWGNLSYSSLRDAFNELSPKGKIEKQMRMMLLHAHNDLYGGCYGTGLRTDALNKERDFFEENVRALILMANIKDPYDRLLKAELYREIGRFEDAVNILREPFEYREYLGLDSIRSLILEKAEHRDSNVFIVAGDKNHRREAILVDDKDYLYDEDFAKNYVDKDYLPF